VPETLDYLSCEISFMMAAGALRTASDFLGISAKRIISEKPA
jgi:hypothetical protein